MLRLYDETPYTSVIMFMLNAIQYIMQPFKVAIHFSATDGLMVYNQSSLLQAVHHVMQLNLHMYGNCFECI